MAGRHCTRPFAPCRFTSRARSGFPHGDNRAEILRCEVALSGVCGFGRGEMVSPLAGFPHVGDHHVRFPDSDGSQPPSSELVEVRPDLFVLLSRVALSAALFARSRLPQGARR